MCGSAGSSRSRAVRPRSDRTFSNGAPCFIRPLQGTAIAYAVQCLSIVIPAECLQAREPGPRHPCGAYFMMPGYLGPGSARLARTRATGAVRDDNREAFKHEGKLP